MKCQSTENSYFKAIAFSSNEVTPEIDYKAIGSALADRLYDMEVDRGSTCTFDDVETISTHLGEFHLGFELYYRGDDLHVSYFNLSNDENMYDVELNFNVYSIDARAKQIACERMEEDLDMSETYKTLY